MDGNFAPDLMIQRAGNRGDMVAENIDLRKIEVVFRNHNTWEGFLAAICWVGNLRPAAVAAPLLTCCLRKSPTISGISALGYLMKIIPSFSTYLILNGAQLQLDINNLPN